MIEIINLNKTYETGNRALQNINITIDDGEFVFIMGRSGSGKSTLMKLLLKETEMTSGDHESFRGDQRQRNHGGGGHPQPGDRGPHEKAGHSDGPGHCDQRRTRRRERI